MPGPADASMNLGCDALLPADLRELALPGFSVKEEKACPTCGPLCTFRAAAEPGTTVSLAYNCEPRDPSVDVRELLAPTLKAGGVEVPALGRAAARRTPVPGMLQVVAWDDDTPCVLVVTWMGTGPERAVEVMRTALQGVSASSLAAAHAPAGSTPPASTEDGGLPPASTGDAGLLPPPLERSGLP
ncbi:MAG: hypothetical protein ACJ8AT_09140 [Hyalangium sp.]|uniref:hypothetical protein n=1 Tax=Hyalangium sp. TaxID=2028555 RepID=UPI003899E919